MMRNVSILLIFLIFSCSDNTENISSNDKPKSETKATTQLNFVGHWLYQGKREMLVREFCNEFEFQNQYCAINLKFPEELYYSRTKANSEEEFISQQLLSDKPQFDILRINDQYVTIAAYMKDEDWPRKYLVDFSQYPEFMQNTRPDLVSDSAKAKWRGIIPGPYLEGYNYTIWYNKDLAKKMKIEVKQIGMTFDDFLGYIKAIDAYNKAYNTKVTPILENGDWSNFNVLMISLYMSEIEDVEEAMKNMHTDKKLKAFFKTLKALEELSKYNVIQKDWKKNVFIETLKVPLNEECFFYINATWMYNYWQNINESLANKMVPCELPVFKPCNHYYGGYSVMWAVPKNAPHKEEAIKFLLKLNQPDIAEKWVRYTKCPTGFKGNVTAVTFGKDHFEDFTYNINKKYGANKFPFSFFDQAALMIVGDKNRNVNMHTVDVVTGLISADDAIADIKKQLRIR